MEFYKTSLWIKKLLGTSVKKLNLACLCFSDNLHMQAKNLIQSIPWIHTNVVPIMLLENNHI